jgi:uncharacterized cofD-like protein
LPVTLDNSNVFAVLENGKIIKGETNIDIPKHNGNLKIKKVYLEPKAKIYPRASQAIRNADLIVIGPGDLYSSLAQILLTDGVSQAIKKSKGKLVYVCNLMTKYGETNNFTVCDFVNEIEKILGQEMDLVIYNTGNVPRKRLIKYKKKHPELLEVVKCDENLVGNKKYRGKDILSEPGDINHDPEKLVKVLLSI